MLSLKQVHQGSSYKHLLTNPHCRQWLRPGSALGKVLSIYHSLRVERKGRGLEGTQYQMEEQDLSLKLILSPCQWLLSCETSG